MIAMRSHKCATTARSWLTNIVVSDRVAADSSDQVEDLGLHRDVERRRRLVEKQQPRLEDQRACDRDALALTAGELMRVSKAMTRVEADIGESRKNRRFAVGKTVDLERFA